jgi:hypothetical protein
VPERIILHLLDGRLAVREQASFIFFNIHIYMIMNNTFKTSLTRPRSTVPTNTIMSTSLHRLCRRHRSCCCGNYCCCRIRFWVFRRDCSTRETLVCKFNTSIVRRGYVEFNHQSLPPRDGRARYRYWLFALPNMLTTLTVCTLFRIVSLVLARSWHLVIVAALLCTYRQKSSYSMYGDKKILQRGQT